MGELKVFSLTLNRTGRPPYVLQRAGALPDSRGLATAYSISKVYQLDNAIAVVIHYSTVGFEGPDSEYMVVTAQLRH